jgi:hypothetical protein
VPWNGDVMNPYEAPGSDEPPSPARKPGATSRLAIVIGIAAGSVLLRWVLEVMHVPYVDRWAPLLIGAAIGSAAASAVHSDPERQWVLFTLAITLVALAIGLFLPLPEGARIFYPWWNVAALSIATGNVRRITRGIERVEMSLARDEHQRALFARRDIRPLAPTKAAARFACGECGDLFVEGELTTVEGKRRCASCVEAST